MNNIQNILQSFKIKVAAIRKMVRALGQNCEFFKQRNKPQSNLSQLSKRVVDICIIQVELVAYHSHPDISEHTCQILLLVEKLRLGSMIFWILY